ncbi:MAG: Flp pilus assembly protein CpaB [Actinomycetota bacterium]|nr:Flp pilus assembly protein CpaB [Actinomycetota bacterium]
MRKWSPGARLLASLAVVFALAAFWSVHGYVTRVQALTPALGRSVSVVVAARDLARGTRLTADMLRQVSFPSRFAPPGAMARPDQATGRVLLAGLATGESLTQTRLAPRRAGPVASLVPEGFRAFAVTTPLPPGSVRPGDHVDLLATFAKGQPHTETVASGVEVLLVLTPGSSSGGLPDTGASFGSGQTLMLLVRPDQAEQLAYARAFADLTVTVSGT